jgi:hypothetical protein
VAGRRYAAGDRVVVLAPGHEVGVVTSERGTVTGVDDHGLTARMDNGRQVRLDGDAIGSDRLDHAYAMTVNRTQGATGPTGHVFGDGGGRELAYVALSRSIGPTHIYAVADDLDQAAEDLRREWASDRRQRWVLDTDTPAHPGTPRRPHLANQAARSLRAARLRAERAALIATLPDIGGRLRDAQRRAAALRRELDDLYAGRGRYSDTALGPAARRRRTAEHAHHEAQRQATAPGVGRRTRRSRQRTVDEWATELADAQREWATVAGPTERQLRRALADADHTVNRLEADKAIQTLDRVAGSSIHGRLAAINHELATLDPQSPDLPGVARRAKISGPGLSL